MQRTQFIAAFVLLAVVAGFVATRFGGDDGSAPAASADRAASAPASDDVAPDEAEAAPDDAEVSSDDATADGDQDPEDSAEDSAGPERLGPARELAELDGWLQTDATSLSDFDGQVRIVQFWTFACINCKNTLPHLQEIYAAHKDDGLEIIGVHTPEFDFEKEPDAIAAAAVDLGVTWPIALDTNKHNFRAWQPNRRFWPRTFVVDQEGEVRFNHIGEGAYDELEATVVHLLENGP